MSELLAKHYGYVMSKDQFIYEDNKGDHDEKAWSYRLGLILKQFYKTI
jgi:hypothetical protein